MSASKNGTAAARAMSSPYAGSLSTASSTCHPSGSSGHSAALQLIDEAAFLNMLSIERKRSDRSGRRFVLVLLHTEELLDNKHLFQDFLHELDRIDPGNGHKGLV